MQQNYKIKQSGLLWLIQLILGCCIVVWLINPISENIYVLAALVFAWIIITFLIYWTEFFETYLITTMVILQRKLEHGNLSSKEMGRKH